MSEKTAKAKRREVPEGQVKMKCLFPPCEANLIVKAPPDGVAVESPQHMSSLGGIPMCPRHAEWLNFYVWAQLNIHLQPQQTKGGIIVPGHQEFKPTLEAVKP